ncbi:hypothetical protein ANN_26759 [Periplaneta americana]|uniref:Uncharacterized protein n=1 Tax=Periplaneta americana TaxID=6978 RepID=A0ABQ8RZI3_PERAM|nr:hypothetical protein ANN_26759 [Periplaneta americana]
MRGSKTKMTFTVTGASKFLQHSVMQFLAAEGVSPIEICRHMKKVYVDNCMSRAREVEAFFELIVTVECNMVQLRTAKQATHHAVEARHITMPKRFRNFTTVVKVMLMLFFESVCLLLCHFMERGESVTSARYSEILRTELRRVVKNKRPGHLREGVILLHDIARPHTVRHTMDTI